MKLTRRNVFAFLAAPFAFLAKPVLGETNPWYPDPVPEVADILIDQKREKFRRLECILTSIGGFKPREVEVIHKLIAKKDQENLKIYKKFFIEGNPEIFRLWRTCPKLNLTLSNTISSVKLWDIVEKSYSPDNFALLEYELRYNDNCSANLLRSNNGS